MSDTTFEALVKSSGLETARALGQQASVDQHVLDKLDQGAKLIDAIYYGISFWTKTLKMRVQMLDGRTKSYFLKTSSAIEAETMMSGEYDSQLQLYNYAPEFIPFPVAWGPYDDGETYFFLSEFVEMTDEIPPPVEFCARLAELHRKSMDNSEGQLFGVEKEKCQGNVILSKFTSSSWREYFQKAMNDMITREQQNQGPCDELERYRMPLIDKIIPRLLDPLQEGENKIKPCLVHGDLWHGNVSLASATGKPFAFDSCSIWAHNEYEMGIWRASRYQFKQRYFKEYHRWIPMSHPQEDWNTRNILYAIRIDLLCSALYNTNQTFRELALKGIRQLIDILGSEYDVDGEGTHSNILAPATNRPRLLG